MEKLEKAKWENEKDENLNHRKACLNFLRRMGRKLRPEKNKQDVDPVVKPDQKDIEHENEWNDSISEVHDEIIEEETQNSELETQ